jgi:glycosyltransferase involved in cell wall biosynthesis
VPWFDRNADFLMIDLLYLAFNRLEFTRKSFSTMLANTDWRLIDRLVIYDDGSTDGTREYLKEQLDHAPVKAALYQSQNLGPVEIMNTYLKLAQVAGEDDGIFVKIDNDVMLPPGWLPECLEVMKDPTLDLLGIEAIRPIGHRPRGFHLAEYIGGIGLMRHRAFRCCLPTPRGRFGFTSWQDQHRDVKKGWLDPALPVCLLNLVPFEPWRSLSLEYIQKGWQRDWPPYWAEIDTTRWEWWAKSQ